MSHPSFIDPSWVANPARISSVGWEGSHAVVTIRNWDGTVIQEFLSPKEVSVSPKADLEYMSLLTEMTALLDALENKGGWGVALCPSNTVALTCAQILSTLIPEGVPFSGRTALLPYGRVSVVCASDPLLSMDSFWLAFIGWETNDKVEDAVKWREKATEILGAH